MNANLYNHFAFEKKSKNTLLHLGYNTIITYEDIDGKVAQYCNLFKELGLRQNDRVVQQTEKCIDALCIYLASLRYGTIYIPLNPEFKSEELSYFIEDAEPALFICTPDRAEEIKKISDEKNISFMIESLSKNQGGTIQEKVKNLKETFDTAIKSTDDIACILYTSGTTGQPKGAMLSHDNLLSNGLAIAALWKFSENDILLHMLPIFHCHGLFFACHSVLLSGAAIIFLQKLDVPLALEDLPKSTVFMGVPTYYTRLLEHPLFNKNITKNIRLFISGSAPLLEKTFYEFEKRTGHKILERYGMTETGINTSNPSDHKIPGTVGLQLPDTEVKIFDDNGSELSPNQPGEIHIKGRNVFKGYWKKEEQTKNALTSDGFFKTGDIGQYDESGYLTIIGRSKEMIITGGFNVYPIEIETIINKINGVKESAIIGLPDADLGEIVIAIIALHDEIAATLLDEQKIIGHLKSKLANYKVPKKVFFITSLPRNPMGKVQKNIIAKNIGLLG